MPKRKKSDNVVKYYTTDKKKKSVSLYEAKKDSEMLVKYMYENRKLWWFFIKRTDISLISDIKVIKIKRVEWEQETREPTYGPTIN